MRYKIKRYYDTILCDYYFKVLYGFLIFNKSIDYRLKDLISCENVIREHIQQKADAKVKELSAKQEVIAFNKKLKEKSFQDGELSLSSSMPKEPDEEEKLKFPEHTFTHPAMNVGGTTRTMTNEEILQTNRLISSLGLTNITPTGSWED